MLVDIVLTVKINVAAESQPLLFNKCAVCVPAVVNVNPFHKYGKPDGQVLKLVVEVVGVLMIKFKVAILSQPLALTVEYV